MAEFDGERSHEATPHRREKAREEGHVAISHDLVSAIVLTGALVILFFLFRPLVDRIAVLAERHWGGTAWLAADHDVIVAHWWDCLAALAPVVLAPLGLMLVVAVTAHLGQVGFLFLPQKLVPDASRVDPWKGLQRIFSLPGMARLGFGLCKVVAILAVGAMAIYAERESILALGSLAPAPLAVSLVKLLFWTAIKIGGVLLVLALLDFGFQWWRHEQDLRMTTQEMREELRNLQGDPQIVARRRAVQRQLVLNRLSSAVPKADVVITNPTELAVAIQYEHETMAAPIVVAKGAGLLAQRIRRLAREHGIPVIEKRPLAQALYKQVEINRPIPQGMYAAVAEILAYVYQLKGKRIPQAPARTTAA